MSRQTRVETIDDTPLTGQRPAKKCAAQVAAWSLIVIRQERTHSEVETLDTNLQTIGQIKTPRKEPRHRAKLPGRIIWRDSRGSSNLSAPAPRGTAT